MDTSLIDKAYNIWSNLEQTFEKEHIKLNTKTPQEFLASLTGLSLFNKTSVVNYILQRLQESLDMSDEEALSKYNFLATILPRCEELLLSNKLDNRSWIDINILLRSAPDLVINTQELPENFFENLFPIGPLRGESKKMLCLPFKEIYSKYKSLGPIILNDGTVITLSTIKTPDIFCYGTNADLLRFIEECTSAPSKSSKFKLNLLDLIQQLNLKDMLKPGTVFISEEYLDDKRSAFDTLGIPKSFKKTTATDFDFLVKRVETLHGLVQVIAI